ncbi:Isochorismatase-like protein [Triangularia verruculosa]|uniref:Isochorismatase-like protein n=1 Tax=Triangularia verruculosa TaxID=2587418 RepID=A0AAN6XFV1_9PEZI|nr:Isochorismatase-like protein [Triangularia verruculosa]
MLATKSAILVVDIQNSLATDPQTKIPNATRVCEAGTRILEVARRIRDIRVQKQGQPSESIIIFIQHHESPDEGPLVLGTEPWGLVFTPRKELDGTEEFVVDKSVRNAFSNPALERILRQHGAEELVVFGIQSECCVEATCHGAIDAGFAITLLSGAHSTYPTLDAKPEEIEAQVEARVRERGATVITWEEAVREWEKRGQVLGPYQ